MQRERLYEILMHPKHGLAVVAYQEKYVQFLTHIYTISYFCILYCTMLLLLLLLFFLLLLLLYYSYYYSYYYYSSYYYYYCIIIIIIIIIIITVLLLLLLIILCSNTCTTTTTTNTNICLLYYFTAEIVLQTAVQMSTTKRFSLTGTSASCRNYCNCPACWRTSL